MRLMAFLASALMVAGCGNGPNSSTASPAAITKPSPPGLAARAQIDDPQAQRVAVALLRETAQGILVDVTVTKLTPGTQGIHVHAAGKCEGPAFATAGGHFNPTGKKHGHNNPLGPHAGDLGNLTIGPDASGKATFTAAELALKEGLPNSVFSPEGTSMVIHANPDDEATDPAGNSGPRVACGVITR